MTFEKRHIDNGLSSLEKAVKKYAKITQHRHRLLLKKKLLKLLRQLVISSIQWMAFKRDTSNEPIQINRRTYIHLIHIAFISLRTLSGNKLE